VFHFHKRFAKDYAENDAWDTADHRPDKTDLALLHFSIIGVTHHNLMHFGQVPVRNFGLEVMDQVIILVMSPEEQLGYRPSPTVSRHIEVNC